MILFYFENSLGNDSNLCCCELTDEAKTKLQFNSRKDHSGIVVKFRSDDPDEYQTLADSIAINTIASDAKISPKLIFVNDQCYIHEYIPVGNTHFDFFKCHY